MNTSAPKSKLHFERKVVTYFSNSQPKNNVSEISDMTNTLTSTHILTLFNKKS
jgi:hypothetical protein